MNLDTSQMTMIWTNPAAYELSKRLVEEKNLNCRVVLADLEKVEEAAREEVRNGAKLIIARGGVWNRIQRSVEIPMVAVRFVFSDFASAIDQASVYGDKIAVVVFSNEMMESAKREYYYWKVKTLVIQVADNSEARREIDKLKKKGIRALIGGITIQKIAEEFDLPCFLFGCNEEAVLEAIYDAKRLLRLLQAQEVRYHTISMLLDHATQGMMTLDNDGHITNINEVALKMIDKKEEKESILGQKCTDIFPFRNIIEGTLKGKYFHDSLVEVKNHYLAVSSMPITTDGRINGIIINIQDSEEIQAVENKIRRHYVAKGYSAKYTFQNIVGRSRRIGIAKQQAMMYAGVDGTVMICGDSGTGKELFAQSIHNASNRRNQPFVAVNCAAFPESLLESELFGYEKGAFTGASPNGKAGIFEIAHKGTIFLDEIGEMPISLQSKLLRVIQEREVRRLGGTSVIPVDVRIITATNKNLLEEVKKGNFRKDLYYRLSVLTLWLPSLEERVEDIVPLAMHFVKQFKQKYGRETESISIEAQKILEEQPYWGNIRELSNIIERAVIFSNDIEIKEEDIKMALSGSGDRMDVRERRKGKEEKKISCAYAEKEKATLSEALRLAGGNHSQAAKSLQISRTTLWRKMKKYGIE